MSNPAAYPHPVGTVEVRQTHISVVFLAGAFAYKVKKPVRFDFLDFSTLDNRRHFCAEEVRLNRRLAAGVYLGVVPVTSAGDGARVEGEGEVIEWAVQMERLPESRTFRDLLSRGELRAELVEELARRLAAFHRQTAAGPDRAGFARFEAVRRNLLDIYAESTAQVGTTVSASVHARLRQRTEEALTRLRALIEERAARGMPRDAHGDLHLDHVYHFSDRQPPNDLVVVDCIEFNERFRFIDPVADIAFLVMDFAFHRRRDLAAIFAEAYFRESGDDEGRALLNLYTAYRATVRGLVDGLKVGEPEVPESERRAALGRARTRWLLALGELEEPDRRPCLILVGGLPGTGKSTLARNLAARAGLDVVRSDEVRKELAGLPHGAPPAGARDEFYSREWSERTYAECLRRAEERLGQGKRVLVDANFREERRRQDFLEAAARLCVPAVVLLCRASPEVVKARLASRHGDPSDADWEVHRKLAETWEEPGPATRAVARDIVTDGSPEEAVAQAVGALHAFKVTGTGS
ncbi:MAG: AAA family ATPase [Planctomycetes bacterium]|nr:AAA family ATPase [Planctomycetota bacterium]